MIKSIAKSAFFKNFLVLFSGTALAQMVLLVSAPFLSRIYTPEDYGVLGVFMSLLNVLFVVVNGRFEMAIMVPKQELQAKKLYELSILFGVILSVILGLVFLLFRERLSMLLNLESNLLLLVPFFTLLVAFQKAANWVFTRNKSFKYLAWLKVIQVCTVVLASFLLAYQSVINGLIMASLLGWLAILVAVVTSNQRTDLLYRFKSSWKEYKPVIKKYADFPLFNILASILIVITQSWVVFHIQSTHDTVQAGYFFHCKQYILAPIAMINMAFSSVFYEKVSALVKQEESIFRTLRKTLLLTSIPLFFIALIIHLFGKELFVLVFGDQWRTSGVFIETLIFTFIIQTIVAPLGNIIYALNRGRYFTIFPIFYFLGVAYLISSKLELGKFIQNYTVIEILAYLLHLVVICVLVKNYENSLRIKKHN